MNNELEIEESVITQIRNRRDTGRKKYGTSMERTDLNLIQWLQHALEESLDFSIYIQKVIKTLEELKKINFTSDNEAQLLLMGFRKIETGKEF